MKPTDDVQLPAWLCVLTWLFSYGIVSAAMWTMVMLFNYWRGVPFNKAAVDSSVFMAGAMVFGILFGVATWIWRRVKDRLRSSVGAGL